MFPIVNVQELAADPVDSFLNLQSKMNRHQWKSTYELVDFTIPEVADYPSIKKKFKIQLTIFDNQTQKHFSKTIFFGEEDDFIFTGNRIERIKRLTSMTNKDNPLHQNYWRSHLCFGGQDFKQNFSKLANYLIDKRLTKLNDLKPKKDFKSCIQKRQATVTKKKMQ